MSQKPKAYKVEEIMDIEKTITPHSDCSIPPPCIYREHNGGKTDTCLFDGWCIHQVENDKGVVSKSRNKK